MPATITTPAIINDEYGHEITVGYIKCNELRVNPDNMSMTIQYWKSQDGVKWGGEQRLTLTDDAESGKTDMTQAIIDITTHLISKNIVVSDGLYVVNKCACYYVVADRVFNTTYTIV